MSGTTLLKSLNSSKRDWRSPIRKMACCLSFLIWLALLQTALAVNVPGPNGTVVTQILSATSSNPEVKVVEDRDLGKILVYPPQPKEFTVKIIARIMYPDDQYLEKISTVMVGATGVTIESDEIRNSLILATLKVAPGASGGRFSITYENEDNPNHKGCNVRLLPVEVEKISFDGTEYYELKKDDLTETYSAPHWINADGTNESVAFKRNSKPKVETFFKLDVPDDLLAKIKIKGVASDGVEFPEQALVKDGGSVKYSMKEALSAFPDTIKFYDRSDDAKAFKIDWQISIDAGAFSSIGESNHQVYVTLDTPTVSENKETFFYLACKPAEGSTIANEGLADKIYSMFKTRKVMGIDPKTGQPTIGPYTYYGGNASDDVVTTGDGTCGGWGAFFDNCCKVHGLPTSTYFIQSKVGVSSGASAAKGADISAFLIGDLSKSAPGAIPSDGMYVENSAPWNIGVPCQGGDAAVHNKHEWSGHCVVRYNDQSIYDPSYGTPKDSGISGYSHSRSGHLGSKISFGRLKWRVWLPESGNNEMK